MFQTRLCFLLPTLLFAGTLFGWQEDHDKLPTIEENLVVTAHRGETPAQEVGSAFTVITAREIEASGQTQISEILRRVPGLDVVSNGGMGQTTSLFMRGANSSHTLVMIDGVEVNDPMSPQNAYDFAHLSVENIERIEVVRGPQSTVYGSDALAGVVHIITRRGEDALQAGFSAESGSFGSYRGALDLRGAEGRFNYALSAAHKETDGVSIAAGTEEEDGYRNDAYALRLGFDVSDTLAFDLTARYTDAQADIDNGPGPFNDDPNHVSDSRETVMKLGASWSLMAGRWRQEFSVAMADNERRTVNGFDEGHPDDRVDASYGGERSQLNWQNVLRLSEGQTLTIGLDHEQEEGHSVYDSDSMWGPYFSEFPQEEARTSSLYVQDHINASDRLALTVGGRYDDHNRFGTETTWRAAASYRLGSGETWLKGSYGTGFKAPTLFQLFSAFGNRELEPETSEGWDLGLEFNLPINGLSFGFGWFSNDYENLVDYDFATNAYINAGQVDTRGGELHLDWLFHDGWNFGLGYTFTRSEDADGEQLVRRPRHKGHLSLGYHFGERADVNLSVRHVGSRNLNDFVTYTGILAIDAYTVADLAGSVAVGRHLRLTARVDNLFDEDYEEVFGYQSLGTGAYGGLRLKF